MKRHLEYSVEDLKELHDTISSSIDSIADEDFKRYVVNLMVYIELILEKEE